LLAFPEGNPEEAPLCPVCEEFGACCDWSKTLAWDAEMLAKWLAPQAKSGKISYDSSVDNIEGIWQEN